MRREITCPGRVFETAATYERQCLDRQLGLQLAEVATEIETERQRYLKLAEAAMLATLCLQTIL